MNLEEQLVRNLVLEEAAAAIEHDGDWCGGHGEPRAPTPDQCAKKIRAMKSKVKVDKSTILYSATFRHGHKP